MEFIGIDFGSYKTTIASSKDNGKILGDEQGKRSIPTVIELTTPIRKFGNSITGEHEQSISLRHRSFRDNVSDKEVAKVYMMFVKYLDRLIKQNTKGSPSICFSVPSYFRYSDRKFLYDISKCCDMKVERFFNDISAIGMFACLRREKIPARFVIFDFGHSKTEVGFFSYENYVFTPLYISSCRVGAKDFDEKLINIILKKYKLGDTKIVRENILRHLEKLKTVLNASPVASIQIYVNESPINVQITQEEYLVACTGEVEKISKFVDESIKNIDYKGMTEITGGNSSSFLIKNIVDTKLEYQVTLDLTESCAIGTSLGLACSVVSNKYKMNDILGRNISIRLGGNDQKSSVVFKGTDVLGLKKTVTYNRRNAFSLELLEDNDVIGNLKINKEETEDPESVKIIIGINKFGLIEIKSVTAGEKDLEFEYSTLEMPSEDKEDLVNTENKYRILETNIEKIGHMRNELETMAMSLLDAMPGNLKELFNFGDEDKVREVAMNLFDIQPSVEIEQEYKVREDIIKQLSFVSEKLEEVEKSIKTEIPSLISQLSELKERYPKKYTPMCYKLQGMSYKLEEFGKKFRLDLFNASEFDRTPFDNLKEETKTLLEKAEAELVQLKKEEEEEKNKQEKAENKQEKAENREEKEEENREEKAEEKEEEKSEANEN
jgi:molecular chaperone DnaK (HSP70)